MDNGLGVKNGKLEFSWLWAFFVAGFIFHYFYQSSLEANATKIRNASYNQLIKTDTVHGRIKKNEARQNILTTD